MKTINNYISGSSRNMVLLLSLLLITVLCSPVRAQDYYYPPKGEWERKSPASMNLDAEKLNAAIKFAEENEYSGSRDLRIAILKSFKHEPYHEIAGPVKERGGPAGLILKNGFIVAEWGDPGRVDMTFSVTKSYLSTVGGLAYDRGMIKNVNDHVATYVWDGSFEGEHNSKITWEHLLNQSSDWSGSLFGMYDWADRPPAEGGIDDWRSRTLNEPGTWFKYNDVRVNLLAYSLLQVWRRPLPVVLKEYVMDPIGASSTWRWFGYETSWVNMDGVKVQSVSGGGHSGGGLFINSYDHARYGLLFLGMGRWAGQQIISENWIRQALQPSDANMSYGFLWWLNRGERQVEGVPGTVFYAAGFGGNYIIIDREHDMVIVTRWLEPAKRPEFLKLVLDSLK